MKPEARVRALAAARCHLLWVVGEERRTERAIAVALERSGYRPYYWDCASGASDFDGQEVDLGGPAGLPQTVFARIRACERREVWILRDLAPWLDPATQGPENVRDIKSLVREMQDRRPEIDKETKKDVSRLAIIVVLGTVAQPPVELREFATVIEWPLPDRDDLRTILEQLCKANSDASAAGADRLGVAGNEDAIIDAAAGLSAEEAANAFSFSLATTSKIKPEIVAQEKKAQVDACTGLSWYDPEPRGLQAIGGLDLLKQWLGDRHGAMSAEARSYGIEPPRGLFLTGLPGTGKSLMAKAIAMAWGLPLLRFDLGALKGSLVGQSESNLRRALQVAEATAPCVLWLDEIEKALGGGGTLDGGVSRDQLGTVLTWQAERTTPVFVVATANDVLGLMSQSPELLRAGRFDAVFFVDLPHAGERQEIFATTLIKYKRDPDAFNLAMLAAATDGFSGAEIARGVIQDGMSAAFRDQDADGKPREVTTEDLLAAAAATVPLSTAAKEQTAALRIWAKERARPASSPAATTAPARQPPITSDGFGRRIQIPEEN